MLAETVTHWTREWKKEGLMEGRKEGRKEGLMEGTLKGRAAALERLLRKRFGEIAPMYLEKIRNASIEQLDIWLERILDAKCIEDVFEP
jgi:flagellar biosynthesis/type III secretory pathway protein FliH